MRERERERVGAYKRKKREGRGGGEGHVAWSSTPKARESFRSSLRVGPAAKMQPWARSCSSIKDRRRRFLIPRIAKQISQLS